MEREREEVKKPSSWRLPQPWRPEVHWRRFCHTLDCQAQQTQSVSQDTPLLSLTILAGATWRIRALSDAIRVSRSICSISAKNALNLHIFEAAGCHIVSGHGGGPTACHAPYWVNLYLGCGRPGVCQCARCQRREGKHYSRVTDLTWADKKGLWLQVWTPVNLYGDYYGSSHFKNQK